MELLSKGRKNGPIIEGQVYGRLTVLGKASSVGTGRKSKGRVLCRCECGKETVVFTTNLNRGKTKSCGCLQKEWASWNKPAITHGKSRTPEWGMYWGAKNRAKKNGLEFNLKVTDINIPDVCPMLGIPLRAGINEASDNSPTLDRVDNTKGYTIDNVWVVSRRANTIKSTASLYELQLLTKNLEEKINNGN